MSSTLAFFVMAAGQLQRQACCIIVGSRMASQVAFGHDKGTETVKLTTLGEASLGCVV